MLQAILGWPVLGAIVLLLVATGFAVLSMTPPRYRIAEVCYCIAALILLVKFGWWAVVTQSQRVERALVSFVVFGVVGLLWVEAMRWVESMAVSPKPGLPQAVSPLSNKESPRAPVDSQPPIVSQSASLHLVSLHAALRKDAENLKTLLTKLKGEGNTPDRLGYLDGLISVWTPNVLSDDIRNHFREYYDKREAMKRQMEIQDSEYHGALALAEKRVGALGDLSQKRRKEVGIAVLDKCLGVGPGMELVVQESSYTYYFHGGSEGGSGAAKVPRDMASAFQAFKAFQIDSELQDRCEALKSRSREISDAAERLSDQASKLAERVYLEGDCEYLPRKTG